MLEKVIQPGAPDLASALAYQNRILPGVSRTFALTIPTLPEALTAPVTNAYLLCRIADTIEDDAGLPAADKRAFGRQFLEVLSARMDANEFASRLAPLLAPATLAEERDLIIHVPEVTAVTASLPAAQRDALLRCVAIMSEGMHRYQQQAGLHGLEGRGHLDEYCYFVAGVVGEMLTELFCDYSPAIARRRDELMELASSFGQGLQMTNILKDIWEDRRRGACWLPQADFRTGPAGQRDLLAGMDVAAREEGFRRLVARAHGHLRNALRYTLALPREEKGIRRFCLWSLGMAVLTLRKIHRRPEFRSGEEVKISRRSVATVVRVCGALAGRDTWLRALFALTSIGLPTEDAVMAVRAAGLRMDSLSVSSNTRHL